jgi:hypothetical protein
MVGRRHTPDPDRLLVPDTATLAGSGRVVFSAFDGALVSLGD